jgi:hypothetical protein
MSTDAALPNKELIGASLKRHFLLRLHMAVILGGTFATGLAATRLLLGLHLYNMAWRYGLSVCLAFAVFVGLIKLWLGYIAFCVTRSGRARSGGSDLGGGDWFDCLNFSSSGTATEAPSFGGGGGRFGGGGATGSWGAPEPVTANVNAPMVVSSVSSSKSSGHSSSGGGFSLDIDGDAGIILLLIALVVVMALAALWVLYAAPAILSEAAFQAALSASLLRHTKKISNDHCWEGSVVRSTILPFLAVLVMAVVLGWYAHHRCPTAIRLREAIYCAR